MQAPTILLHSKLNLKKLDSKQYQTVPNSFGGFLMEEFQTAYGNNRILRQFKDNQSVKKKVKESEAIKELYGTRNQQKNRISRIFKIHNKF